jgi:diguanylate cyclase (GGDEF)-like protein/PAS domain S-box-containing protein
MNTLRIDQIKTDVIPHWRAIARALLFTGGIALLCFASMRLTLPNDRFAVIWPANGVVLGLLLTTRQRRWSHVIGLALAGNLAANLAIGETGLTAGLLALCNTLETVVALLGCRSANVSKRQFGEPLWIVRFALCAIIIAPAAASLIAASVLYFDMQTAPLTTFVRWFPADALGIAMFAPLTMVLRGASDLGLLRSRRLLKPVLSVIFLMATTVAVFAQPHAPLLYMIYLALGVAIFNAGFSGAVIGLAASMVISIVLTVHGPGQFMLLGTARVTEQIQQLQIFFAAALAFTFPLSSLQLQRQRLGDKLKASEQRFRTLAEHSSDVIMRMDSAMRLTYVSPSARELFGYHASALLEMPKWALVAADDLPRVRAAFERVRLGLGRETFNYRALRLDGQEVWVEMSLRAVRSGTLGESAGLIEFIGSTRDISERKAVEQALEESNARLSELAHRDGLTELYNRRFFDESLDREYRRARRDNALEISLLMLDVDHFKQYNDLFGHQAGDECLKVVANAIGRACKRPPDTPARYGGEEFAVILPNTTFEGAAILAERMRSQISMLLLQQPGEPERRVTVSIGVASISPYYDTQETLVRKADEALYRAKAFGRNRVWPAIEDLRPGIDSETRPVALGDETAAVTDIRAVRATAEL